jgi:hypothetical protein
MTQGLIIGLLEIAIYFFTSYHIRKRLKPLIKIDAITYYWLTMTILTLIWEFAFVLNYKQIGESAQDLIITQEHVWTKNYDLTYLLPWKLSSIFYAEYGAYADRMYMQRNNDWSRIIESTHALFCGLFAYIALHNKAQYNNRKKYLIAFSVSMGSQLMNSILYMASYFNQLNDPYNVNHCHSDFPCGFALYRRPFMYVNILWTLMPLYTIIKALRPKKEYSPLDVVIFF